MKVNAYFDTYIDNMRETRAITTVETYRTRLDIWKRLLQSRNMEDISRGEVQNCIEKMNRKYAAKTVQSNVDIFKAVCKRAYEDGTIVKNPCIDLKMPLAERHQPILLGRDQLKLLYDDAPQDLKLPIAIAIDTGIRRCQILALSWKDIDFEEHTILVDKSVVSSKNHVFTKGKEKASRIVNVSRKLTELLYAIKNKREDIGISVSNTDYVCLTAMGKPFGRDYFSKRFRKFVSSDDNFSNELRFHDIRWSYINNRIADGVDPRTVANEVGHSSALYTLDYYCKFYDGKAA